MSYNPIVYFQTVADMKHISKIKEFFDNLNLKTKFILLAVLICAAAIPGGFFLHNSLSNKDELEITGVTDISSDGEVAGESTRESESPQASVPTSNKKAFSSPSSSSSNQQNQSTNGTNNNSGNNNSSNTTPSTTSSSSNNPQTTNASPNPSPSPNSSSPNPSPSPNNVVLDASWTTIERSADGDHVTGAISANENLKSCIYEYSASTSINPNGGVVSGSNCNFEIFASNIKSVNVTLEAVDGDSKQLSHSF